jgi:hypothetical protein
MSMADATCNQRKWAVFSQTQAANCRISGGGREIIPTARL